MRRPKILKKDEPYLDAFEACSRSRQPGGMGGSGPILISEVEAYLRLLGIDSPPERLKYLKVIQNLDSIYLADAAERRERAQKQNKKP